MRSRPKVDEFVPHTQHVNLRIVGLFTSPQHSLVHGPVEGQASGASSPSLSPPIPPPSPPETQPPEHRTAPDYSRETSVDDPCVSDPKWFRLLSTDYFLVNVVGLQYMQYTPVSLG